MSLSFMLILGCAFALPEIIFYNNVAWFRRLMDSGKATEVVISLGLGVLMAFAMGIPAGATVAIGNFFATAITITYYRLRIRERMIATKRVVSDISASVVRTYYKVVRFWRVFSFIFLGGWVRALGRKLSS